MELFQLKCFLSVVEQQSFTEGAYAVSISQSSLSKYIGRLEDQLGAKLFDRSKRAVTLTPAGRVLEGHARRLLQDYGELEAAMKRFSGGGRLHIGSIDHMGRVGLAAPIASFLKRFPHGGVEIEIEKGDTLTLMNLLIAGRLDMAFVAAIASPVLDRTNLDEFQLAPYQLYPLVQDSYHVVVGRGHPLAGVERVSWPRLAQERLLLLDKTFSINPMIRQTFHRQGLTPQIGFECDQVDTLLGLAEQELGVALLSKKVASARYDVCAVPMEQAVRRDTILVVPRDLEGRERLAGHFVRHVVDYYREAGT